jgi:ribosomal protein S18 acetylase RimI-like enzyme
MIRKADLTDLEAIVPLFDAYRQFYKQAPDLNGARAYLKARLENHETTIFMDHTNAAFALLYDTFSSVPMQRLTILNDLYTKPEARGQGLGTALIQASREHALEMQSVFLRLRTATDNVTAQSVYERIGFIKDEIYLTYNLKP